MGYFFGLGKRRTKLGKWIDQRRISQEELYKHSEGISRSAISRLCNDDRAEKPTRQTALKIIRALKKITGEDIGVNDFWA